MNLCNTSEHDLFSKAGWIMINKFIEQEMRKPENKDWLDNATFVEVLAYALKPAE